jgi:hypothetical protein
MQFVSTSQEVMIVDAKLDTWEIPTRFAQKKTMKKGMICVKIKNADLMQFAI